MIVVVLRSSLNCRKSNHEYIHSFSIPHFLKWFSMGLTLLIMYTLLEGLSRCSWPQLRFSHTSGAQPQSLIASPHKGSSIKKVIGVVSGKGGVGKSMVTDLLAVAFSRKGYHCAIMDADITGPSIPKAFGLTQKAEGTQDTIYPVKTKTGIDVMSINLLLENETDPVIWRGPVIAGAVKQFWTDVLWEDVDYMFVDMPPGTGDVPLTVFQSLP